MAVTKSKDGMYHYIAGPGNEHGGGNRMTSKPIGGGGSDWTLTQDPKLKKNKPKPTPAEEKPKATRDEETNMFVKPEGGKLTDRQKEINKGIRERMQFKSQRGKNREYAISDARGDLEAKGLNPDDYMKYINEEVRKQGRDLNYKSGNNKWSNDTGSLVLDAIRGDKQLGFNTAVNKFAPEGYENTAFADTMDDPILQSILDTQYGEATTALDRAKARGSLNDTGYQSALDALNAQKSAGMSTLQDIGGGILSGYRSDIGDIIGNARTGANTWDFGSTYDPNTYKSQVDAKVGDYTGRLEGDIRGALGDTQLFDWSSLISKGGIGQGPTNPGLGGQLSLQDAIAKRKQDETASRGLGTQGSF